MAMVVVNLFGRLVYSKKQEYSTQKVLGLIRTQRRTHKFSTNKVFWCSPCLIKTEVLLLIFGDSFIPAHQAIGSVH